MRIGFLCPSLDVCGGVQRTITVLANAMADQHQVVVVAINNQSEKFYYPFRQEVKTICLNQFVFRKRNLVSGIVRKLERRFPVALPAWMARSVYFPDYICERLERTLVEEKCDCIIANTPHCSVLLGLLKGRLNGTRLIGWQHSSYEIYYEIRGKGFFIQSELAKKIYQNLDRLVTLTKQDARAYEEKMGVDCCCIHNPLSFQSTEKSAVDHKKILFVGRLESYLKGLDYLLEIMKILILDRGYKDWNFQVIGDGSGAFQFKQWVEETGLSEYVELSGEHTEVRDYYCNASIFISTSRFEGFGLAVTEAMECGLPVVSFRTDGPSEIIYDGVNGYLIEKYSVEQFADAVERLMTDPLLRKEFSQNAMMRAKDFHMDQILEQWERVIHE